MKKRKGIFIELTKQVIRNNWIRRYRKIIKQSKWDTCVYVYLRAMLTKLGCMCVVQFSSTTFMYIWYWNIAVESAAIDVLFCLAVDVGAAGFYIKIASDRNMLTLSLVRTLPLSVPLTIGGIKIKTKTKIKSIGCSDGVEQNQFFLLTSFYMWINGCCCCNRFYVEYLLLGLFWFVCCFCLCLCGVVSLRSLGWKLQFLALQHFRNVQIEEVTIQNGLNDASKNGN